MSWVDPRRGFVLFYLDTHKQFGTSRVRIDFNSRWSIERLMIKSSALNASANKLIKPNGTCLTFFTGQSAPANLTRIFLTTLDNRCGCLWERTFNEINWLTVRRVVSLFGKVANVIREITTANQLPFGPLNSITISFIHFFPSSPAEYLSFGLD